MENVNSLLAILASLVGLVAVMLSIGRWVQIKESNDENLEKRVKRLEDGVSRVCQNNGNSDSNPSGVCGNGGLRNFPAGPIPPDGLYGHTRHRDNDTGSKSSGDSNPARPNSH